MTVGNLFPLIIAIFMAVILLSVFTQTGRRKVLELGLGCKVQKDFGEISQYRLLHANQKLSLLGCTKDGENFLVIEIKSTMFLSFSLSWIKIDDNALNQINSAVKYSK